LLKRDLIMKACQNERRACMTSKYRDCCNQATTLGLAAGEILTRPKPVLPDFREAPSLVHISSLDPGCGQNDHRDLLSEDPSWPPGPPARQWKRRTRTPPFHSAACRKDDQTQSDALIQKIILPSSPDHDSPRAILVPKCCVQNVACMSRSQRRRSARPCCGTYATMAGRD
jgi:hypothetical protein